MILLERLLSAAPGIRVNEVVDGNVLIHLPMDLAILFGQKTIKWRTDREVWGLSFDLLKDMTVELGHVRGHHIAARPEYHGVTVTFAQGIVCKELEGTLLHELGHAVLTYWKDTQPARRNTWRDFLKAFVYALEQEGCPSGYGNDDTHEAFAEAFRWWAANPVLSERDAPNQTVLIVSVLNDVEERLSKQR